MNPLKPREKKRISQTHARRELLATQPRRRSSAVPATRAPETVTRSCGGCGELAPRGPVDDPDYTAWVAKHQAHSDVPTA